jgi:uncharacterized protein YgiM (DUF1202 family)
MTPEKKKLLLFGGGAAALTLLVYFIFFNKKKTANPNPSPNPLPKPKPSPINEDPESEYEEIEEEEIEQVTTRSGTRLREKPTTDSKIVKTYQSGVKLTVIGSEDMLDGTWYEILSPRGYVRSDVVD